MRLSYSSTGTPHHAPRLLPPAIACMLASTLAGLLTGCSPVYYPTMRHAPLFTDDGETQLSGNLTTDGYEVMAGGSPVNHLGVIGAYAWGSLEHDSMPIEDHRHGEIALCYYSSFGPSIKPRPRYEIMGGYGIGSARTYGRDIDFADNHVTIYPVRSEYQRTFIQANLGGEFRSNWLDMWVEGGGAIRFAYLRFATLAIGETSKNGASDIFIEPSLFLRIGDPLIMAELQIGSSQNFRGERFVENSLFDYPLFYGSLGFHLRLWRDEP